MDEQEATPRMAGLVPMKVGMSREEAARFEAIGRTVFQEVRRDGEQYMRLMAEMIRAYGYAHGPEWMQTQYDLLVCHVEKLANELPTSLESSALQVHNLFVYHLDVYHKKFVDGQYVPLDQCILEALAVVEERVSYEAYNAAERRAGR